MYIPILLLSVLNVIWKVTRTCLNLDSSVNLSLCVSTLMTASIQLNGMANAASIPDRPKMSR